MSLASSLLAPFAGKDYTNFRRARARTPNESNSFKMLVLLAKASHPPLIAARDLTGGQPVMLQWQHSRVQYYRFSIQYSPM